MALDVDADMTLGDDADADADAENKEVVGAKRKQPTLSTPRLPLSRRPRRGVGTAQAPPDRRIHFHTSSRGFNINTRSVNININARAPRA